MSLDFDPGSLRRGHLTYFPVVPGRVEFSIELRRYLLPYVKDDRSFGGETELRRIK